MVQTQAKISISRGSPSSPQLQVSAAQLYWFQGESSAGRAPLYPPCAPLHPCPLLGKPMALCVQVRKCLLHFAGRLDTAAVMRAVTQSGTETTPSSESSGPLCWTAAKTTTENRAACVNKKKESFAPPPVLVFSMTSILRPVPITSPCNSSDSEQ